MVMQVAHLQNECKRLSRPSSQPRRQLSTRASAVLDRPASASPPAVQIPDDFKNNVAVLTAPNPAAPEGVTTVYVLGMSHVSKKSCDHVRRLVKAVKPEVVAVELCKERLALLVDADKKLTNCWHVRKVLVEGAPGLPEWPTIAQLRSLLKTRVGRPVSTQDIEDDVRTLLGTGLFRSVKPGAQSPTNDEAPEFIIQPPVGDAPPALSVVPPLGSVRFLCEERQLPPLTTLEARLDSSLQDTRVTQEQLDEVCAAALEDSKGGASTVLCLLRARNKLAELCGAGGAAAAVAFTGAELGRVDAVVKAVKPSDPPYISGLEASAVGGEGIGIDVFRPTRDLTTISERMSIPTDVLERLLQQQRQAAGGGGAEGGAAAGAPEASTSGAAVDLTPRTQYREWTEEEILNPASTSIPEQPVADAFSRFLTSTYARIQADAGSRVGIDPGAAWQVALEAATEAGTQQFLLADRPADVTQRKLADRIFAGIGARVLAAVAITGAAVAATTNALVPDAAADAAVVFVAVGGLVQLLWPVVGPFAEVYQFSRMSAEQIEETVAMKRPIDQGDLSQPIKVYGEDALLDWPGAMGPVIDDRDAFMGKALAAAATGTGITPGYVLDRKEGQLVWRYMMAADAPAGAAPAGRGDGSFQPLPGPRSVVAVVGTAHVHGMVRDWDIYLRDTKVDDLLAV